MDTGGKSETVEGLESNIQGMKRRMNESGWGWTARPELADRDIRSGKDI